MRLRPPQAIGFTISVANTSIMKLTTISIQRRSFLNSLLFACVVVGGALTTPSAWAAGPRRGRGRKAQAPAAPQAEPVEALPPPVRPSYSNSFDYLIARKQEQIRASEATIQRLNAQLPALWGRVRGKFAPKEARPDLDKVLTQLAQEKNNLAIYQTELLQLQAKSKASSNVRPR